MPSSLPNSRKIFAFDGVTINVDAGLLLKAGKPIPLGPRPFEVLLYLIENRGRIVTKQELFEQIWGSDFVTDAALTQVIKEIRLALGDDAHSPKYVRTVHRKGYQFIAPPSDGTPVPKHRSRMFRLALILSVIGFFILAITLLVKPTEPQDPPNSIVVLPFINMSDDAGNEYFSDGVSEELLNMLAKIPELRVISRSSAFSFKGRDLDIPTLAKQLNVTHVLEGSVRKAGNQVRITVQLIDALSDTHLWSESYDRDLDDIFAVQDEISQTVVNELMIRLAGEAPRAQVVDPEAYALVLKARYFFNKWGKENFTKSLVALEQALTIEPEYAEAWSMMSTVYLNQVRYGYLNRDQGLILAREANERALAIDPNLSRAWANLSHIREANFDWAGAEAANNKALELAPRNPAVLNRAANLYNVLGRHEKALAFYRRILSDDPLSLFAHFNSANVLDRMGQLEEAVVEFKRHLELNPEDWGTHSRLAIIYLRQEHPERAMEELELDPDPQMQAWARILVLPALGRGEEASRRLDTYITKYAERLPHKIAAIYGWYGNNDDAFKWLNRAVDQGDLQISDAMGLPLLAGLHDDPRWPEFLARMGLPY